MQPPYGDVDDRIRAIANAMNLRTIMWIDDTDDWMIGEGLATKAQIDANYQGVIDQVTNGTFSSVRIVQSLRQHQHYLSKISPLET